jgi:hypothetical protein
MEDLFALASRQNAGLYSIISMIKGYALAAMVFLVAAAMPFIMVGRLGYLLAHRRWLAALKFGILIVGIVVVFALPYLLGSGMISSWLAFGVLFAVFAYNQSVEW